MSVDIDFGDMVIAAGGQPIELVDQLLKRCDVGPRSFILEAGSGTGKLGMSLASKMNCAVVLLDRDIDAVDRSARYLDAIEALFRRKLPVIFRIGDLLDLPFHDGTFDLVFNEGVIEHFEDPIDPLREMARVSAAWVAAVVPNAKNERQVKMAAFQMERHAGTERWQAYEKPMTQEELEGHLARVGLEQVQSTLTLPHPIPPQRREDYRMILGAGKKSEVVVKI